MTDRSHQAGLLSNPHVEVTDPTDGARLPEGRETEEGKRSIRVTIPAVNVQPIPFPCGTKKSPKSIVISEKHRYLRKASPLLDVQGAPKLSEVLSDGTDSTLVLEHQDHPLKPSKGS